MVVNVDGRDRPPKSGRAKIAMYDVNVSGRFVFISFMATLILSFTVGRVTRLMIEGPIVANSFSDSQESSKQRSLPSPILLEGKEVPITLYTSKNFDTSKAATMSSLYLEKTSSGSVKDSIESGDINTCDNKDGQEQCTRGKEKIDEEDEHLPAGQHLLVDMKNIDGNFLNSEERLAHAMVDVVNESKLTLLSYHCHSLIPMGVSCVGVLLESHISFHTWPEEGVITLDLFTCGSGLLVPVMPILKRLFAIPQETIGNEVPPKPVTLWSHKMRGFRPETFQNHLTTDLSGLLEPLQYDLKEEIASVQTDFQRIDIYDFIDPTESNIKHHKSSLSNDDSYESRNPELFLPDRHIFLDGVHQSARHGNEAYHEALVHPAMFAHPNPKRAGIIGGGECATLREILKHNTIENVKMIEIDEGMVNVSREFLPDWSDCSDIIGSVDGWCGDDSRAEMYYEDALAWFIDRFADDKIASPDFKEDKMDVIVMDALDPQDHVPFAKLLYSNVPFFKSLYNALNDDGLIVLQVGNSPLHESGPDQSADVNKAFLIKNLEDIGFTSIHTYEESHCLFERPWSFIVASKSLENRQLWYSNIAETELKIHERILRTKSGKPNLKHYDGATVQSYQNPHKAFETVYCRSVPTPTDCHEIDDFKNSKDFGIRLTDLEIKMSSTSEKAGRGVFTKVDIKKGDWIGMSESKSGAVYAQPSVIATLYKAMEINSNELDAVFNYLDGYGWESDYFGKRSEYSVESHLTTFINHGCKDSHNVVSQDEELIKENEISSTFNPFRDRHLHSYINAFIFARRDIKAGEELLGNYFDYSSEQSLRTVEGKEIEGMCEGTGVGRVTRNGG